MCPVRCEIVGDSDIGYKRRWEIVFLDNAPRTHANLQAIRLGDGILDIADLLAPLLTAVHLEVLFPLDWDARVRLGPFDAGATPGQWAHLRNNVWATDG